MEAAVIENSDLPGPPNSFSLAKAAIENIMGTNVTFGPMAFGSLGIVTTFDEETANIVVAIATHDPVSEREVKLHPMAFAGLVIVKTNPGPGGVKLGAHN
jgi:hypothetical protein